MGRQVNSDCLTQLSVLVLEGLGLPMIIVRADVKILTTPHYHNSQRPFSQSGGLGRDSRPIICWSFLFFLHKCPLKFLLDTYHYLAYIAAEPSGDLFLNFCCLLEWLIGGKWGKTLIITLWEYRSLSIYIRVGLRMKKRAYTLINPKHQSASFHLCTMLYRSGQ